jgi:hypothetical protein
MNIQALVSVLAIPILIVELTFAHLSQIVFVEVVTGVSFLAKALEPVLADVVVVLAAIVMLMRLLRGCGMTVGASTATRTVSGRGVVGAYWDCCSECGDTVGTEEWCEAEIVRGIWRGVEVGLCNGLDGAGSAVGGY